jgi:hypothetical protein
LGYGVEELESIEDRLGTADMMKLFAAVGSKMGEDDFDAGDGDGGGFGLTPAAAKQQLETLKLDKEFMNLYLAGDKDAMAKYTRLMGAANA